VDAAQQEDTAAVTRVERLKKALQDVGTKVQQQRADSWAQDPQGVISGMW